MGIWSSIGHAILRYGPYVAAPFTGGASLALAPMANAADAAWTGIDQVRNANQGQSQGQGQGLGPSQQFRTVRQVPKVGGVSVSTGLGPSTSPTQSNLPQLGQMQQNSGNIFGSQQPVTANTNTQLFNPTYGMMPQDSTNPNLSFALNQGKTNALMNQPWRAAAGIYPNIPLNQRGYQPAPMPLIPQATTFPSPLGQRTSFTSPTGSTTIPQMFQQPGMGADWQAFLQQNPDLMQQLGGRFNGAF